MKLEPLNEQELQAAVMARHRLSGYEHSFDRSDGSPIDVSVDLIQGSQVIITND